MKKSTTYWGRPGSFMPIAVRAVFGIYEFLILPFLRELNGV